jgi:hypothetical protein
MKNEWNFTSTVPYVFIACCWIKHRDNLTFFCGEGPRSTCYGRTAALRLLLQPCDEDDKFFFAVFPCNGARWNETDGENRSTRGKTCPSATLSTINPTWTEPGSNPGIRSNRPATNRLSHGTATTWPLPVLYMYLFPLLLTPRLSGSTPAEARRHTATRSTAAAICMSTPRPHQPTLHWALRGCCPGNKAAGAWSWQPT